MRKTKFQTNLILKTFSDPKGLKGLDSVFEAIVDKNDRLIAIVPVEHGELVLNSLLGIKVDA